MIWKINFLYKNDWYTLQKLTKTVVIFFILTEWKSWHLLILSFLILNLTEIINGFFNMSNHIKRNSKIIHVTCNVGNWEPDNSTNANNSCYDEDESAVSAI